MYTYDVNHHFDEDLIWIEKYQPELTLSMVYFDGESQQYFAKRFKPEELSGKTLIIAEHESSRIELVTSQTNPQIELIFSKVKGQQPNPEIVLLNSFTGVSGIKTKGKKLSAQKIKEINLKEPEEITQARSFLSKEDSESTGLSPVELHRRAMEKLNKTNAKDFLEGDGQISFNF